MAVPCQYHCFVILFGLLVASTFFGAYNADTGSATFYKPPYVPSACYANQWNGVMIAGASDQIWDNRAACGRLYRVRCIRGANASPHPCKMGVAVTVKVVDYCPPPYCNGTINLSIDAFAQIADPKAGKVIVSYDRV